ncbi:Regulatory protein RecX [hydrothermal vent metagenome]|uniref:Regulatory protein RecX n=1 Tax=hydrothermal vent metagenome TaxID=652676 RepID=A0A3B0Z5N3_9ZZZZ
MWNPLSLLAETASNVHRQAYAAGLRLLARREHSIQELCHKLKGRECPAAMVEQVADELVAEGLLSDRRFAEAYVYNRAGRGFGPLKIQAELRDRGISDSLALAALAELAPDWVASARRQRHKRFHSDRPIDFNARVKQQRFLQQRGFTSEQSRAAFHRDTDEED